MEVANLNDTVVTNEVPVLPNGVIDGGASDPVVPVPPSHVYSKEVLMKLRKHALSQVKPKYLDSAYVNAKDGMWDPELWMSVSPAKRLEERQAAEEKQGKVSAENDSYSFTPQRRSFVAGCHVTPARNAEPEVVEKEKEPVQRRGGTGRVVARDAEVAKDRREGPPAVRAEAPTRAERQQGRDQRLYREKFVGKETRRPHERSEHENDHGRPARGNNRDRRKYQDETPEWFSGGPTSQNETIELKGFDDGAGKAKKRQENMGEQRAVPEEKQPEADAKKEPTEKKEKQLTVVEDKSAQNSSTLPSQEKTDEFNIDDFLKMDSLSLGLGELDLGLDENKEQSQGSRFSRWFKNEVDVSDVSGKFKDVLGLGERRIVEQKDPAKSLLELLQNGMQQATHLEKTIGPAAVMNNLNSVANYTVPAATRSQLQDDFANRSIQQQQQQSSLPFQVPVELQQRPDVQLLVRDMAVGRISRQQASQQLELIALQHFQQKQALPVQPAMKAVSSSSLAFTPTAVMRKMTAEKEKDKQAKLQLANGADPRTQSNTSPPIVAASVPTSSATSTRLTGRTASQLQGAERVSSQLGLNAVQHPPRTDVHMNPHQAFSHQYASNAAMTDMAMKLLEQQKQQQLLANAISVSTSQNHFKQYQRTSPLPQPMLPASMQGRGANLNQHAPGIGRSGYGSVSPQPPTPMNGPGFAPFMAGLNPSASQTTRGGLNSGYMQQMSMRAQGQGMNSMMQQGPAPVYSGSRSPVMQLNNNPLGRWLPPELLSQASNRMPGLAPMPSQKMMSLEELERLLATPMPH